MSTKNMLRGSIFGIFALVLLTGCLHTEEQSDEETGDGTAMEMKTSDDGTMMDMGVISSIKDAMKSGAELECVYTDATGEQTTTVNISGDKMKAISVVDGVTSHILSDGESQYIWSDGQTDGIMISESCTKQFKDLAVPGSDQPTQVESIEDLGSDESDPEGTVTCSPTSGTDFTPPATVTFIDQCEFFQGTLEELQNQGLVPQQ